MMFFRRHLSVCCNSGHSINGIFEIKLLYLGKLFFSELKLKTHWGLRKAKRNVSAFKCKAGVSLKTGIWCKIGSNLSSMEREANGV
jgi:hypothetical protein